MSMLCFASMSVLCAAGQTAPPPDLEPGLYTVVVESTPIRSGASSDNYAFLKASDGTTVRVTDTLSGWARVPAEGPAFEGSWGWVRYPAEESGRFELQGDHVGVTHGRTDIYAPNLERDSFTNSYRWVCTMPTGTEIHVLESTTFDATETGSRPYTGHRVALPAIAEGWINASDLRPATTDEIAVFNGRGAETVESEISEVVVATPVPVTDADMHWWTTTPTSPLANWVEWRETRQRMIAAHIAAEEAAEAARIAAELDARRAAEEEARRVALAEAEAAEQAALNQRWMALEATLTATPLYKLDAKAVDQLRAGYVAVVDEESERNPDLAELATMRLRQLDLAKQINATREDIESGRARISRTDEEIAAARRIIDESPNYVLRGRLGVSPVFDGVKRPILYRLQDPFSGRSLAYVSPDSGVDLRGMLGQRVGIVGTVRWNPEWRITMVEPERVDLVSVSPSP